MSPVISHESTPEKSTSLVVANFEKPNEKTATDKQNRRKTVAKKKSTGSKDANRNEEKEEEAAKKKKKATPNRKRKETESPSATTRSVSKKQRLEEEEAKVNKMKNNNKKKQIDAIVVVEKEKKKKEVENKKRKMVEKEKKVVKRQKGKKNGKGKMGEEEDEDEGGGEFFKSLRAKTTVKPFYNAVHSLSPERKQRVREMGFGTLLGFPYIEFPSKLPYFILKHLDDDTMQVKLPNGGVIEITPSKIREVLGIPMGPMSFFADNKRLKGNSEYCQFMAQLPRDARKRTTTTLSNIIQTTEGTDFMFDLNFLMLFANCLGTCSNSSMLKYHVLENVMSSKDIPNIDWCVFIWNCIKESKKKWDDKTLENWYYGPHVTFTVSNS
ncbi:hypothetical protein CTI12_AA542010 [Artemisia annua]|uniref:Ulp1 protease family, C-terminal catalytic domain-containing protein n=1 Tax=Artemisia annua TaxID=35608 RepID=A0A2U1L178_ARTAN|nr:hypothetical protein CTI12_AA542010 [Artemisia annua]